MKKRDKLIICGHSILSEESYLFLAFRVIPPVTMMIVTKISLDISSISLVTQQILVFFPMLGTKDKTMSKIYMGFT